jgi:hypothetical protein
MVGLWILEVVIYATAALVAGGTIGLIARWRQWRVDRVDYWGMGGYVFLRILVGFAQIRLNMPNPFHSLEVLGHPHMAIWARILLTPFVVFAGMLAGAIRRSRGENLIESPKKA